MSYKLRLTQRFQEHKRSEFIELEKKFMQLERENPQFPKGKRYLSYIGREPGNTLIWECEFVSLDEVLKTLEFLRNNPDHDELFQQQVKFFLESYVEIYQALE
ncbi:MAG TPA: hypothetical protein DDW65_01195 [Firmicutes bacterium]|jgi:hypothetical protein|nr:hypothetical protein [Bacillota bacterium]